MQYRGMSWWSCSVDLRAHHCNRTRRNKGSHAALRSGCCFGRGCTWNSPYSAPLRFTASLHFFLFRSSCHHVLVCRDRTWPHCSLTLLLGDEPFLYSHQDRRLFVGILHHHLRNIRRLSELV